MCAQSQLEISDLAKMVHSAERGHRVVAVITFKFDESYDDHVMCVGGWIGEESEWRKLEGAWRNRIAKENARNRGDQQITRFHATEMNGKYGEYANWDKEMCIRLCKELLDALRRRRMGGIAIACDMNAVRRVFPKGDEATEKMRLYRLCIKLLMTEIAHVVRRYFEGDQVMIIYEHGNWDQAALEAYNLLVDDPQWKSRELFCGFTSLTKQQSIGFEACDFLAYEVFKGIKSKIRNPNADMRATMAEMHKLQIPVMAKWIDSPAAELLHKVMEESGKYPDLDEKGIT